MKDSLYILVAVKCLFYIIIPAFLLIGLAPIDITEVKYFDLNRLLFDPVHFYYIGLGVLLAGLWSIKHIKQIKLKLIQWWFYINPRIISHLWVWQAY